MEIPLLTNRWSLKRSILFRVIWLPLMVLGATLSYGQADYSNQDLTNADLSNLNLTGAKFTASGLTNTNFTSTVLRNADFTKSYLLGTRFEGADLTNAIFTDAVYFRNTIWPQGFTPTGRGMLGPNENYTGRDLSGKEFRNFDFFNSDFTNANLSGTSFVVASLEAANLTNADMSRTWLFGTTFWNANLTGTIFTDAWFNRGTVWPQGFNPEGKGMYGPYLDYKGRDLSNKQFFNADFIGANFTGANLSGAGLTLSSFESANLTNADMRGSFLFRVDFTNANLNGANLNEAAFNTTTIWPVGFDPAGKGMYGPYLNYSGADFSSKYFRNYDFTGANLCGTNLNSATLSLAGFAFANLSNADLRLTDIHRASFYGAILNGVDFTGATDAGSPITTTVFTNARYDTNTKWPAGFDPVAAGAILTTESKACVNIRLALSSSSIASGSPIGTQIGTFSNPEDPSGIYNYALVAGSGDTDNAGFSIEGNRLVTLVSISSSPKTNYSVRVRLTNADGLTYEKIFILSVPSLPSSVPLNGLVGWWPFNGNANDESGNGYHATVNGPLLAENRKTVANSAYVFDGMDDNISLPLFPTGTFTNQLTFAAWIYNQSTNDGPNKDAQSFFLMQGGGLNRLWVLKYNDLQNIRLYGQNYVPFGSVELVHDKWYHVAFTVNGNTGCVYVNGKLVGCAEIGFDLNYIQTNNILGFAGGGNQAYPFKGKMDEVGLWNRALTAEEIANLCLSPDKPFPSFLPLAGLEGWWPFNGNANDESGNGNNGTAYGAVLTDDLNGNPNSAYDFGLDNSAFIRTLSAGKKIASNFTYSAWVKPEASHLLPTQGAGVFIENLSSQCVIHPVHGLCIGDENIDAGSGLYVGTNGIYVIEHTAGYVYSPLVYPANISGWTLVSVVYENDVPNLYVNGELVKTGTKGTKTMNASMGHDCYPYWGESGFGRGFNKTGFRGKIDDIAVWSRILDASELRNFYAASNPNLSALTLSSLNIKEGLPTGSIVGTLSNGTAPTGTYAYSLVSGTGSADNSSFNITGNELRSAAVFSKKNQSSYQIRIKGTDTTGMTFEKSFIIYVLPSYVSSGDLVGWWPFDGNSNDESGNGYHASVYGSILASNRKGNANSAYQFDGMDDGISLPLFPTGTFTNQLTFAAWIYNEPTNDGPNKDAQSFFLMQGGGLNKLWILKYNDLQNIRLYGQNYVPFGSVELVHDKWYHVAFTINGSAGCVYVNGKLVGCVEIGFDLNYNQTNNILGFAGSGNQDYPFKGKMDEVGLWKRALTAEEIANLWLSSDKPFPSFLPLAGLEGWWPFNGNANDESGNGNNGTAYGAVLTDDLNGKPNSAYDFGINNNAFIRTLSAGKKIASNFTYSAWVKPEASHILPIQGAGAFIEFLSPQCVIHPVHGLCVGDETVDAGSGLYVGTNGIFIIEHTAGYVYCSLVYPINVSGWTLVSVVYENDVPNLYVDGELVKTGTKGTKTMNASMGYDCYPYWGESGFGRGFNKTGFRGKIDDIAVWSRILNASEIRSFYEATSQKPSSLTISSLNVKEGLPIGSMVGTFSNGTDSSKIYSYSLVSGDGSADNSSFTIAGNVLKTAAIFNKDIQSSYQIRVKVTDSGGTTFEKAFVIYVLPAYLPAGDLAGWWPFNGNADDESGNGHHGDVEGPQLSSDRFGKNKSAYHFDYPLDLIKTESFFDFSKDFTWNFWTYMKRGQYQWIVNTLPHTIIGYFYDGASMQLLSGDGTYLGSASSLQGWSNGTPFTPDIPLIGAWVNHTILRSGKEWKIYLNGSLVGSFSTTADPSSTLAGLVFGNVDPITSGANLTLHPSYAVAGIMDDIAIYNRALTENEIVGLYGQPIQAPTHIALDNSNITEGLSSGTVVGNLSAIGGDSGAYVFSLVPGAGDTDNQSFSILNDQLKSATVFNAGLKSSLSIRVRVTDGKGKSYEQSLSITVFQKDPFITVWRTDLRGIASSTSAENQVYFQGIGDNYVINWESTDNPAVSGSLTANGPVMITFPEVGTYRLKVSGNLQQFSFNPQIPTEGPKLIKVEQWGRMKWTTALCMFCNAYNNQIFAQDIPDFSLVESMEAMFSYNFRLNADISRWDVSKVTSLRNMFVGAISFNKPLDKWNVGGVTDMYQMFADARSFNQPLGKWNVSNVTSMDVMFSRADKFNQDLSGWCVPKIPQEPQGFAYACPLTPGFMPVWGSCSARITFNPIAAPTYGDLPITLNASASTGLPVTFSSSNPNVATISGNTLTITGAGTVTITATQPGDSTTLAATPVTQTLTVSKATLTAKADDVSRAYNTDNPALTVSYTGFKNGDLASVIDAAPVASTTAVKTSLPGTYPITVAGGSDNNYTFSYSPGTLTVTKLSQTVSFTLPAELWQDQSPYTLTATSTSGGTIVFSVVSGNATVSGNVLTITGSGPLSVKATQAGTEIYSAAEATASTTVANSYIVSGLITKPIGIPITSGLAKLFYENGGLAKNGEVVNGAYSISLVRPGRYILQVVPTGSTDSNVFPAYYNAAVLNKDATVIVVEGNVTVSMEMPVKPSNEPKGQGEIKGKVTGGNGGGRFIVGRIADGAGLPNVPVYLLDLSDKVIKTVLTDKDGLFTFTELVTGTYKLALDVVGASLGSSSTTVNVDPAVGVLEVSAAVTIVNGQPVISLSVEVITGLNIGEASLWVYPNPAEDEVRLVWRSESEAPVQLQLASSSGQIVQRQSQEVSVGTDNELRIQLKDLPQGMYLLRIEQGAVRRVVKVVKR